MALSPFGLCCLVWKASQDESFALTLRSHGAPGIRERGSPCGSPWDPGAWQPVCGVVGGELWVLCAFRAGLGPQGTPGPRAALLGVSPCAQPRPSAPRSPTPGTAKRGWARLHPASWSLSHFPLRLPPGGGMLLSLDISSSQLCYPFFNTS